MLNVIESLAVLPLELLHIIEYRGQSRLMLLEHRLKSRKRSNRRRGAAVVSALAAAAPERSNEESRLVGQNCDRYIFGPTVAGKILKYTIYIRKDTHKSIMYTVT